MMFIVFLIVKLKYVNMPSKFVEYLYVNQSYKIRDRHRLTA